MRNSQSFSPTPDPLDHFARNSYEKLVHAARDLGTFTQHGITANFISELADRCEQLQKQLEESPTSEQVIALEAELKQGLAKIREAALQVWGCDSPKAQLYN